MLKSLPLDHVYSSFALPKMVLGPSQQCMGMPRALRMLLRSIRAGSCGIRSCSGSGSGLRPSIGADLDLAYRLDNGLMLTPRFGGIAVFAALDNNGAAGTASAGLNRSNDLHWDFDSSLLYGIESEGEQTIGAKAGAHARF